jgi:RNA polymerase sigma-70 factor (ECF subfamily)
MRTLAQTATSVSLLERLRQPFDVDAWGRFVALYTPLLFSWARSMGLREQDAADLVQDVFVTLLQVLPTFRYDPQQSFRRWLHTIIANKWRNGRKKARGVQALAAADVAGEDTLAPLWEQEFQQHVMHRALEVMRLDFNETTWKACWEVIVSGRPAADVAADFGITLGAVYAAKCRVLARLRQELTGMLD